MADLWSIQLKPNEPATFIPLRTLKFSNATLGLNLEDANGRTVVLLTQHPISTSKLEMTSSFEAAPICCLTASKDEHMHLDVVLAKSTKYTFVAVGPNSVHLLGYFLAPVFTPTPHTALPSASSISSVSSASSSKSLKRQGSDGLISGANNKKPRAEFKRPGYMYKDEKPGNKNGKVVAHGDTVTVDVKATWNPQGSSAPQVLYQEEDRTLTLDGSSERGWKESIAGMKLHGVRIIKVPSNLATGEVETKINQTYIIVIYYGLEVTLNKITKAQIHKPLRQAAIASTSASTS
ncbi:hypothetical protein C8R43DRAFT_955240 [Mycena crocata]|nr:hypothetical protein C8R43DRAFT_955240 [Mycena crocata]